MSFGLFVNNDLGANGIGTTEWREQTMRRRLQEIAGCLGQMACTDVAEIYPGMESWRMRNMQGAVDGYDASTGSRPLGEMLLDEPRIGLADARTIVTDRRY